MWAQASSSLALTEHPDFGNGEMARRFRQGHVLLLRQYLKHDERNGRGWVLPQIEEREPTEDEWKLSLEEWFSFDVPLVRSALSAHLVLADGLRVMKRSDRKMVARTLALVGAEGAHAYNILTRFNGATRSRRKQWED